MRRNKATGKTVFVHRDVYEQANGPLPPEVDVHHKCNNKPCYELTHLVAVTKSEHKRKHAARTHCSQGHEFTEANTYYLKNGEGWRVCRACRRKRQAQRYKDHHDELRKAENERRRERTKAKHHEG